MKEITSGSLLILVGVLLALQSALSEEHPSRTAYLSSIVGKQIMRVDVDGDRSPTILLGGLRGPYDIFLGPDTSRVFWSDLDGAQIVSTSASGQYMKLYSDAGSGAIQPYSMDYHDGYVYWTDGSSRSVTKRTLSGGPSEELISEDLTSPRAVRVDKKNGKIYWSDVTLKKIERANLDGSGRETVVSDVTTSWLELNPESNSLYWSAGSVFMSTLTGDNQSELITANGNTFESLMLNPNAAELIVAETGSGVIYRYDLAKNTLVKLIEVGDVGLKGIRLDVESEYIYWTEFERRRIRRAKLEEAAGTVETVFEPLLTGFVSDISIDESECIAYLAQKENGAIVKLPLDTLQPDAFSIAPTATARALHFDPMSEKLYWISSDGGSLLRANADGSEVETVTNSVESSPTSSSLGLQGLFVDGENEVIYLGDTFTTEQPGITGASITKFSLTTNTRETLLGQGDTYFPGSFRLDSQSQKLYFSDIAQGGIGGLWYRVNLDGSNRELIFHNVGILVPKDYDISPEEQLVYWLNGGLGQYELRTLPYGESDFEANSKELIDLSAEQIDLTLNSGGCFGRELADRTRKVVAELSKRRKVRLAQQGLEKDEIDSLDAEFSSLIAGLGNASDSKKFKRAAKGVKKRLKNLFSAKKRFAKKKRMVGKALKRLLKQA